MSKSVTALIEENYELSQRLKKAREMEWQPIETCPYRRTVVLGLWYMDCWIYRTLGHRKDDHFVDEQWRPVETATHWHDLAQEPPST